jgi:hypothetical protein
LKSELVEQQKVLVIQQENIKCHSERCNAVSRATQGKEQQAIRAGEKERALTDLL